MSNTVYEVRLLLSDLSTREVSILLLLTGKNIQRLKMSASQFLLRADGIPGIF